MNIHLHIEKIVMDGLSLGPLDHHQVKAAVEAELGALLVSQGLGEKLQNSGEISYMSGNRIEQQASQSPRTFGQHIAQSIYGGFQ